MKRKRSELEIRLDILASIKMGERRLTRIMYRVNLSWDPMLRRLKHLLEGGLVEQVEPTESDKRTSVEYVITEEGVKALHYFADGYEILTLPSMGPEKDDDTLYRPFVRYCKDVLGIR